LALQIDRFRPKKSHPPFDARMLGMNPAATRFLDKVHDLPTIPAVVRELLVRFDRDDTTIDTVAELISTDPVISAKVMRLANSAFYRRPGTVSSVFDAVAYIGLHAIRTIVLGAGVMGTVRYPAHFSREMFWRYSLHSAASARYFAQQAKLDADTAFTAGLIHAIGAPLIEFEMANQSGGQGAKQHSSEASFFEAKKCAEDAANLGFCFSDLSADLIERWHFPLPMVEAIRHRAEPLTAGEFIPEAALVWLGTQCASDYEKQTAALLDHPLTAAVLAQLHLTPAQLHDMPPVADLAIGLNEALH
jgi:HD-like signal output (HDOD) protein